MPKERIRKSGRDGYADLLVQWGRDELGADDQPRVRLFLIAAELGVPGSFWFEPKLDPEDVKANPARIGAKGEMVGPVDVMLDRQQINRMIRTLRRARDQAYGRDE